jgi:hypothetical protein
VSSNLEALEMVGKSGQLRTQDGWTTPVIVKEVRFAYGRTRLVVMGVGPDGQREATVEANRVTLNEGTRTAPEVGASVASIA